MTPAVTNLPLAMQSGKASLDFGFVTVRMALRTFEVRPSLASDAQCGQDTLTVACCSAFPDSILLANGEARTRVLRDIQAPCAG